MALDSEVSVSALPWYWVIETLARSQQLSAAHLHELLSKGPPLSGDLAKEAREAVVLRCLEGLFCSTNGSRDDQLESHTSKVGFHTSDSHEDVVRRVLLEAAGFNLKEEASDVLKADAQSFIALKKTSLGKCTLELLKDELVRGTHPVAVSLRSFGQLALGNKCTVDLTACDNDQRTPPASIHENINSVAEDNNQSLGPGIVNQLAETISPKISGEKGALNVSFDNLMHANDDTMVNHEPPGKKLKLDHQEFTQLKQQQLAPDGGGDLFNDAEHLGNETPSVMSDGLFSREDVGGPADTNGVTLNNKQASPINDENHPMESDSLRIKRSELDLPQQQVETMNEQLTVPLGGGDLTDAAKVVKDVPSAMHDGISSREDFGGPVDKNDPSHNLSKAALVNNDNHPGETNISRKKAALFNSECMNDGLLGITETEENLCMKCTKGGQLLICGNSTCPLAFHESCLGGSTSFDDQGKFYCPYCKFARASSDYVRAKEEMIRARKELSLFIGGRTSSKRSVEDANQRRQDENDKKTAESENCADAVTQGAKCQRSRSSLNKQQKVLTASPNAVEAAVPQSVSSEGRNGTEMANELARGKTQTQNQGQDCDKSVGGKLLKVMEQLMNTSPKRAKVKRKADELHEGATSESISVSDGQSADGNKATSSLRPMRPRREVSRSNPSRRKKVPWTSEEEEMLKKGVQKFWQGEGRSVPWKDILEFGEAVFHNGRTAVDLKDKWKNILRASKPKG